MPLAARRTSQFQPQLLRPFAGFPTARCYSTENGNKEQKENEAESEAAEDPVAKELEEKRKEVVDLKVNPLGMQLLYSRYYLSRKELWN